MPTQQGDDEHPHRHWSHQLGSLYAESVVMLRHPGRDIVGEQCMVVVVAK
jgi:hypothetical protein